MEQKYSLFLLERQYGGWGSELTEECFMYVYSYSNLEDAQSAREEFKQKTIIIPTY